MLRIASLNLNGIRAAHRRGFGSWLDARSCDVVALQEVRCPAAALPAGAFAGYQAAYDPGHLAGRNGVAILTRQPVAAVRGWGDSIVSVTPDEASRLLTGEEWPVSLPRHLRPFAHEGRYLEVDLAEAPLTVASLYLPKGGLPAELQVPGRMRTAPDNGVRYLRKMRFMAGFARFLTSTRLAAAQRGRHYLLMGDFNIAHGPLDVVNWRRQQRVEGFLPQERAWLDGILGPRRLVDVVRQLQPHQQGPYTWWSWLGTAFEKDAGWRIDYHLATSALARRARRADVDREASREARLSDHAAVVVEYDLYD